MKISLYLLAKWQRTEILTTIMGFLSFIT